MSPRLASPLCFCRIALVFGFSLFVVSKSCCSSLISHVCTFLGVFFLSFFGFMGFIFHAGGYYYSIFWNLLWQLVLDCRRPITSTFFPFRHDCSFLFCQSVNDIILIPKKKDTYQKRRERGIANVNDTQICFFVFVCFSFFWGAQGIYIYRENMCFFPRPLKQQARG